MDDLIKYTWANKLLAHQELITTDSEKVEIISAGEYSENGIFRSSRVKIGDKEWVGDVIIIGNNQRQTESDNAILYITEKADRYLIGNNTPLLQIILPQDLVQEYNKAHLGKELFPCEESITRMAPLQLHSHLSRLLIERIEEKSKHIEELYSQCNKRWNDTLFILLSRNFGFGIKGEIFEEWAKTLNMQALGKHSDNLLQIEAIFFGQAGLLDENQIPTYYREEAHRSKYYNDIVKEYKFLSNKFGLKSLAGNKWQFGNSSPHLRIARLAKIYHEGYCNISKIAECNTIEEVRKLFEAQPDGYWRNHLQFGGTETSGAAPLRNSQTDLIIINTVVPILYSYGKHRKEDELCNKAEDLLHSINAEQNSIIRRWAQKGVNIGCAADSQAFIQLSKAYCNKFRCTNCHFGYTYIKNRLTE